MVTDRQVRLLMELEAKGEALETAAARAGMDDKTARKYRRLRKLPSQVRAPHLWRTREDPFSEVWEEARKESLPSAQGSIAESHFVNF